MVVVLVLMVFLLFVYLFHSLIKVFLLNLAYKRRMKYIAMNPSGYNVNNHFLHLLSNLLIILNLANLLLPLNILLHLLKPSQLIYLYYVYWWLICHLLINLLLNLMQWEDIVYSWNLFLFLSFISLIFFEK